MVYLRVVGSLGCDGGEVKGGSGCVRGVVSGKYLAVILILNVALLVLDDDII